MTSLMTLIPPIVMTHVRHKYRVNKGNAFDRNYKDNVQKNSVSLGFVECWEEYQLEARRKGESKL